MAALLLRLLQLVLLLILCISQPILLNAIPITRTKSLEHASLKAHGVPQHIHTADTAKRWDVVTRIERRMDVELHDYPGSGANNRHRPPQAAQIQH